MTGITVFPGEISAFTEAIAVLSGFIVIFGFVSMFVKEKLFISEACRFGFPPSSPAGLFDNLSLPCASCCCGCWYYRWSISGQRNQPIFMERYG